MILHACIWNLDSLLFYNQEQIIYKPPLLTAFIFNERNMIV